MFHYFSRTQDDNGPRLSMNFFAENELPSVSTDFDCHSRLSRGHMICKGNFTRTKFENQEPAKSRSWGEIVDSPLSQKEFFSHKDLVYVKFCKSQLDFVREGDRFNILDRPASLSELNMEQHLPGLQPTILGEIEITSVGSDLVLGIIVGCRTEISKGSWIGSPSRASLARLNSL
ncbi:MAG: hypothetical protein V1897_19515 [Pseudomonadota bacterium]